MKRLLIYPALVPIMSMLSAWAAIGQRELMVPAVLSMSSVKPNVDLFAMLILGVPFVLPAMLLDAWRHKRRDCPLEELIRLGAMQWFWLTLYASLAILLNWTLVPALQSVTDFPIQQYLYYF